jgi:ankyrin repeat protein
LALLGTEGARCTDAAGGQVAAQAAPSPELLRLCGLPAGAPAAAVRAALNKKDGYGDLPIHLALRGAATGPELVRQMLDAGGDAMLAVPNNYKMLPLHRAAMHSQSPAVVALLLARGPAGVARAEDADGWTPLVWAERGNMGPGAEEIKALLRAAMR